MEWEGKHRNEANKRSSGKRRRLDVMKDLEVWDGKEAIEESWRGRNSWLDPLRGLRGMERRPQES